MPTPFFRFWPWQFARLLCAVAKTTPVKNKIAWFFFRQDFLDNVDHLNLGRNIFGGEKKRRSGLGMGLYNTCAKRQDLSLKNGVDIGTFVRNNWVRDLVSFKWLDLSVGSSFFAILSLILSIRRSGQWQWKAKFPKIPAKICLNGLAYRPNFVHLLFGTFQVSGKNDFSRRSWPTPAWEIIKQMLD